MSGSVFFRWLVPAGLAALLAIPFQSAGAHSMGGGGMGGGHGMGGMGRAGFGGRGTMMRSRSATSARFFRGNGMNFSHNGMDRFGNRQNFASRSRAFNSHDRLADRGDRFRDNRFDRDDRFRRFDRDDRRFFFRNNFFVGFNFGAFGWWPGWWWGGPWWWGWDGWAYPYAYSDYGYPYGYDYSANYDDPPPSDSQYGSKEYWSDLAMSVQSKLTDDGYYHGEIDGVLGSGTLEAVRQFQTDHGLDVTGKIDPALLSALGIKTDQQQLAQQSSS
jgi:Putative peptidoglycan binding domain